MPDFSWSLPRVGETLSTVCCFSSNFTGSAPYLSTFARSLASPCVKLPVICTGPEPKFAVWNRGADCTMPSRTIATLFCGGCFENDAPAS